MYRSVTGALRNNLRTQNKKTAKENVDLKSYIFLGLNHYFRSFVNFKSISYCEDKVNYISTIDRFHMTSRRPYWCTKNLERWPVEFSCENDIRFSSLYDPPRETSPAAKSQEKRMFSQASGIELFNFLCKKKS